ncbi:MAG: large-conductance mechanosensitive channel protein MscL [Chitinophagales bacterium]|nr:large-conductance mechanosensitive channel protein MscL [Chitinophagales bacterium]MDW8394055.1 large-conductance mechanosensitive channel protein MscL [Chitinophagales bacterium]
MKILKEFKEFALRGNLIDIAVGFVMGAAFGKLTSAFIDGMVMPLVGLIQGKDLSDWEWVVKQPVVENGVVTAPAVTVKYGAFISVAIEFLLIAWVMFIVVKAINAIRRKQEAEPAAPPEPSAQEKLLMEIRDLLKK